MTYSAHFFDMLNIIPSQLNSLPMLHVLPVHPEMQLQVSGAIQVPPL